MRRMHIRFCNLAGIRNMASAAVNDSSGSSSKDDDTGNKDNSTKKEDLDSNFECNICLDTAKDAVVSYCGHLFCWPCLHQWLETRPNRKVCPVCKAGISKQKVIPLYGRGNTKQQDPRDKLPPRPQGQRSEPENSGTFPAFSFGDGGIHMSFGIGAFPFGLFTTSLNLGDGRPAPAAPGTPESDAENHLSKLFIGVAILFLIWLLIA